MLFQKKLLLDDIVIEVVKNIIQSTLLKVTVEKIVPHISILLNYLSTFSYYLIFKYLIFIVVILLIFSKVYSYLRLLKLKIKSSSSKISSIPSESDEYDFDQKKMKKMKNKKSDRTKSKNILTTDLISSY
jgi:sensor histidine kinase YesM